MGQTGRRSIATHILAVKIVSAVALFHSFGVARQGPWITWVNKLLGRAGFLPTSRPRDDAKLLHHAEVIPHRPVLHDPPISDTHDIDEPHRHLSAGWKDAHELALMGAVKGLACRNLVPFGHHGLYGEIRIREGLTTHDC